MWAGGEVMGIVFQVIILSSDHLCQVCVFQGIRFQSYFKRTVIFKHAWTWKICKYRKIETLENTNTIWANFVKAKILRWKKCTWLGKLPFVPNLKFPNPLHSATQRKRKISNRNIRPPANGNIIISFEEQWAYFNHNKNLYWRHMGLVCLFFGEWVWLFEQKELLNVYTKSLSVYMFKCMTLYYTKLKIIIKKGII